MLANVVIDFNSWALDHPDLHRAAKVSYGTLQSRNQRWDKVILSDAILTGSTCCLDCKCLIMVIQLVITLLYTYIYYNITFYGLKYGGLIIVWVSCLLLYFFRSWDSQFVGEFHPLNRGNISKQDRLHNTNRMLKIQADGIISPFRIHKVIKLCVQRKNYSN